MTDEPKAAPQDAPETTDYDPTQVPNTIWASADWTIQGYWSSGECTDGEFAEAIFPDSVQYTRTAVADAALAQARDDALEEAAIIAQTLKNAPMPTSFMGKCKDAAVWVAGGDNHGASIGRAIRALKGKTDE